MSSSEHTHSSHLKTHTTPSVKPKSTGHSTLKRAASMQKPAVKNGTSYDDDPFANMQAWVDYQEKIQLLKTTIAPMKKVAPKNYGSTTTQQKQQRQSATEISYPGNISSNISVLSSSSSCSNSSDGCLTPPRSISPITSLYEEQSPKDVSMEDKVRFLSFLRHRTGWDVKEGTVSDLEYMQTAGSLFWHDNSPRSPHVVGRRGL